MPDDIISLIIRASSLASVFGCISISCIYVQVFFLGVTDMPHQYGGVVGGVIASFCRYCLRQAGLEAFRCGLDHGHPLDRHLPPHKPSQRRGSRAHPKAGKTQFKRPAMNGNV